jgi:subtilisin family serine protease
MTMTARRSTLAAALSTIACSVAITFAQNPITDDTAAPQARLDGTVSAADNETPELWFVELASAPTADGTSLDQVRREKNDFRSAARAAGLSFAERYAFDTLWNGLSVRIARSDVAALSRVPGVAAIYPVGNATLAQDQGGDQDRSGDNVPDLFTAITMTGADIVQNSLGFDGRGVRVAIMDTGIDYTHPDLGGCFGPGCRVTMGYDFVGDAFDNSTNTTPVPDPDPMDCNGHGTHVAGIVGARAAHPGGVTGVAPGVEFHAYRVFGCTGSTTEDLMIGAMERILADGADVLNMSIGAALAWPQFPTAQAATRLVNHGIAVVASAGNDGALGLYATSAPALGSKVISVASFDNIAVRLPYFTITPDGRHVGYSPADGAPAPPTSGSAGMARTGTPSVTNDACSPIAGSALVGKVALIRRGTCAFYTKAANAQAAGAIGVVIYNNATGFLNATVAGTPAITIPVVTITAADGVEINNRMNSAAVTMTWTDQLQSFPNSTGGLISSFSSYGVSPDLALKPDVGAPGGLVFSTLPVAQGGYGTLSGTSMSSPHVAGAAALLLQAHPHVPSQAVRSILQNSAEPHLGWGNPGLGFLDNVHRQGAGMLRIDRAILNPLRVDPGKLSLGESESGPATRTLTISNGGDTDLTVTLSHVPALATGPNTFTPAFIGSFATVTFSAPSLSVPAGGTATVDATITAPATAPERSLYGGYLVVTGGAWTSRVPYAGFKGDYQSIPVLTPTPNNFPWLAKIVGGNLVNQPGGASFTLQNGDVPIFLFHLDHQSQLLRLEVQDTRGRDWHRAFEERFMPRNSTATSVFGLTWDGRTTAGNKSYTVPNGQYRIVMTVLKALGDENNPAHTETWTSPVITIARP